MSAPDAPEPLLRQGEVARRLGVSVGTLRTMIRERQFPAGAPINRREGWPADLVAGWIRDQLAAANGLAAPAPADVSRQMTQNSPSAPAGWPSGWSIP